MHFPTSSEVEYGIAIYGSQVLKLLANVPAGVGSYHQVIVSHLPGGHLPPPKFGHLPPPNSDVHHLQKQYICQEDNCHPQFFFFFFWRTFLGFFDLQLMEDIKDGKKEVLDEVVMEHIK